jgi:C1A family cysteine protease
MPQHEDGFEYGFGRTPAPDPKDKQYPMRMLLDPLREAAFPRGIPPGTRHYWSGPILNQGNTGTCVAHGWTAKVNAAPIMQRMPMSPYDFYRRIVKIDEWSENDHEATAPDSALQSGTSVRAGAKILTELGLAKSYVWAESAEDVRAWILGGFGGVVIGIWWKTNMMKPDSDGFIHYTGESEGGHCVYLNGWNDSVERIAKPNIAAARGPNSWGSNWGQKGRFWFPMDELDQAIKDDGEACALVEIKVHPRVRQSMDGITLP